MFSLGTEQILFHTEQHTHCLSNQDIPIFVKACTVLIKSANTNLQTREQHPEEGKTLVVRVKAAWLAHCFLPSANPILKAKDLVDLSICSQQV